MPGDERPGRACVICKERAIAPTGNEKYCKEHWEVRLRLLVQAKARFTCRRMTRGIDFEHYVVDHEDLGRYCAEFIVLKESDNLYHVTVLLHQGLQWKARAFELPGDPHKTSLQDIAAELPVDEAIGAWGGGNYDISVHESRQLGSLSGEW